MLTHTSLCDKNFEHDPKYKILSSRVTNIRYCISKGLECHLFSCENEIFVSY